ncbi:hypothetical protein [Bizionia myxarmorum]|uniref:STAS/SEC14 domain-containing protein n=1 Tax=Bizionia myxarmorum TaxID=291186 RepID=A0A5D0QXJ2_9FLAO|nr:hypothetical protein [Bizionia myxarmorum]TYB73188.1 hypothetical protein ES674_15185 [Bizionia myxarmorum]
MPVIKKFHFGELTCYSHYAIAVMDRGITVTKELNKQLRDFAAEHYNGEKFVYITHRVNSYCVDPNIYYKTSKIENLMGFAIVFGETVRIDNSDFESAFISIPFKAFNSMDEAIAWADDLCDK